MVAVFIRDDSLKKHRVVKHYDKNVCTVRLGASVGKIRVKRLAAPFGGDCLFYGDGFSGFSPFPTDEYKTKLLFIKFSEYLASGSGKHETAGIVDKTGRFLDRLPEIQANCRSLLVVTDAKYDGAADDCMQKVGAIPDFIAKADGLMNCDTVFAADGLTGYGGVLFGKGGIAAAIDRDLLPSYCRYALDAGTDPTELAALLCADEPSLII